MTNDAEKLEVISGYYRMLDDDMRRRLDRIRQSDGNAKHFSPLGYSQILDNMYEIHLKHEQVKEKKCAEYERIIEKIKSDSQRDCIDEIKKFVSDNIGSLKKSGSDHD